MDARHVRTVRASSGETTETETDKAEDGWRAQLLGHIVYYLTSHHIHLFIHILLLNVDNA